MYALIHAPITVFITAMLTILMWNQLFGYDKRILLHLRKLYEGFIPLNNVMCQVPTLFDSLDLRCKTLWCLSSRFALDNLWHYQRMELWEQWRSVSYISYNVDTFIMDLINRYGYYQHLHAFTMPKLSRYPFYKNTNSTMFRTPYGKRVHLGYCSITHPQKTSILEGYELCKTCKSECFMVNSVLSTIVMNKVEMLDTYKQLITTCKMWTTLWSIVYPGDRKAKINPIHIPDNGDGTPLFEIEICEKCNDHILRHCGIKSTRITTEYGRPVMLCSNCYKDIVKKAIQ